MLLLLSLTPCHSFNVSYFFSGWHLLLFGMLLHKNDFNSTNFLHFPPFVGAIIDIIFFFFLLLLSSPIYDTHEKRVAGCFVAEIFGSHIWKEKKKVTQKNDKEILIWTTSKLLETSVSGGGGGGCVKKVWEKWRIHLIQSNVICHKSAE